MNEWTQKSIDLCKSGYLNSIIQEVYPWQLQNRRTADPMFKYLKIDKKILKGYYDDGKDIELILDLIKASKGRTSVMKNQGIDGLVFPVQHPLVGFIREIPEDDVEAWLKQEKEAVKHIIATIKNIQFGKLVGFDAMIEGMCKPIEMNRKTGGFSNYVKKLGYQLLSQNAFTSSTNGICILDGGDSELEKYAKEKLGYKINKGLDLVAKVNKKYVIGEAKWIGTPGGNQDKSGKDAFPLLNHDHAKAIPINVLDGYVWLSHKQKTGTGKAIIDKNDNIFSALLLGEFLESLR